MHALAVETAAATLLSDRAVRRPRAEWPVGVERIGESTASLDTLARLAEQAPGEAGTPDGDVSPSVAAAVELLADGDEAEAAFWTEVVERALDVMAAARHTYQEVQLRRDPVLREELGLSGAELAALAALLLGPRRGNREAQSLLLALRRNLRTRPEDVVGAVDRIRFLTSRRHAADVALPVPAAA